MFYREFLSQSPHLGFPVVALVLFFVVFLSVVIRLARGMIRRQSFDHEAALPLENDAAGRAKGGSVR